jgi:hypothetical protein
MAAEIPSAGDGAAQSSKTCNKCGITKPLAGFSRSAHGRLGYRSDCKVYHAAHKAASRLRNLGEHRSRGRKKYWANPAKARAATAKWRMANRDAALEKERERREANREVLRQRDRDRIARDPDRHRQKSREYRERHPDRVRAASKKWAKANPEKVREASRRRLAESPKRRITNSVRAAVHRGLSKGGKNGRRTFEALGYSVDDLLSHLERQFLQGMSWENFGEWEIDHRLPLAMFDYRTVDDDEFKQAWSLTNLQPLWAPDNRKKRARRLTLL